MNANHCDGGSQAPNELLSNVLGEKDRAHAETLTILDWFFAANPVTSEAFEAAARASVAAFLDPSILAKWPSERRNALCRSLILQEATPDEPPALHACIASNNSAGVEGALAKSAAALAPTLAELWDEGCRELSFLLLVLLLRRHLGAAPYSAQISRWHRDMLPQFNRSHMTLPYNMAFDRESVRENVNDIVHVLQSASVEEIAQRFAPWQILIFHWITQGRSLDPILGPLVDALRSRDRNSKGTRPPADAAALRSLSLRAGVLGNKPGALDAAVQPLAMQWGGLRRQVSEDVKAQRAVKRLESTVWQAIGATRNLVGQKMPYLKIGQRRPRIAVCVSGQLRGYRRAFPSWKHSIIEGAECHFFVHSWIRIGQSAAEPHRAFLPFSGHAFCDAYRKEALRIGITETVARYPTLFSRLGQSNEVTRDELATFYETDRVVLEDDSHDSFSGWSNSRKMHYKIAAAHDLLGEQECEFDLVLRIRPDKELGLAAFAWSDVVKSTARPVIFADVPFGHQYATPTIGDQFAIGAPSVMRAYADTIKIVPELARLGMYECPPDFHGHTSLARTCWHAGVDVRRFPVRMGRLFEADALTAGEIAKCLREDCSGRMDAMDQALLEANCSDLRLSISQSR